MFGKPKCSFCGKSHRDVAKLVSGRHGYICDQCVAAASFVLEQDRGESSDDVLTPLPSPFRRLLTKWRRPDHTSSLERSAFRMSGSYP